MKAKIHKSWTKKNNKQTVHANKLTQSFHHVDLQDTIIIHES